MAELTHLYILVFPERNIIKVGKADGVHERIQSLRRWWGEVDYEASYHLAAPLDVVFRLEKSLHFLLSKDSVMFEEGDGRTELFSCDALEIALKHIDLFCSSGTVTEALKKGVLLPPAVVISKRRPGKHVKYHKKNMSLMTGVTRIAEQFCRINRLLIILLRKQEKLAYQYDIVDGHVYFRLRLSNVIGNIEHDTVMQMLSFNIEDFNGYCGRNCCSVTCADGILQYNVRLLSADGTRPWDSLFSYFSQQSEYLLKRLPKRSPAATDAIPMLNEAKIFDEIMEHHENSVLS